MNDFFSRRNQVYPTLHQGRAAVKKCFERQEDWLREVGLYTLLGRDLPLPQVLWIAPQTLITEYLPHPHLLAVLEEQAHSGFEPAPWDQLVIWLQKCETLCGKLPADGNLRNFLWDEGNRQVIGLDLEGYESRTLEDSGAELLACLLEYTVPDSNIQERIAEHISSQLNLSSGQIQPARDRLLARRSSAASASVTGIVLAGGQSSRMGRSKARLPLMGMSLLERQILKLERLGCREILISGPRDLATAKARTVPDIYFQRGPLGGLHACLTAARSSRCLVLAVDVPLVPIQVLDRLCRLHTSGITLAVHQGRPEPLLAVYDSALAIKIPPLFTEGGASVRRLLEQTRTTQFRYRGPELFLENCNTPASYEKICAAAKEFSRLRIPLL